MLYVLQFIPCVSSACIYLLAMVVMVHQSNVYMRRERNADLEFSDLIKLVLLNADTVNTVTLSLRGLRKFVTK